MTEWLGWLRAIAGHEPAALVQVLASEGSVPRGAGTRMLVTPAGQRGSIGGGRLEHQAIAQARALLDQPPGQWLVQDYPLGPLLGQCCGGRVRLLVEHVDPSRLAWLADAADAADAGVLVSSLGATHICRSLGTGAPASLPSARGTRPGVGAVFTEILGQHRRPLLIFGAGHVGQAIAAHAHNLPFGLEWFDTRPAFAAIDGVALLGETAIESCVADAPADAAIVILTHDHGLDYRIARAALAGRPLAFVGLIGSATKAARFQARLARDGIDAAARARLTSPIGLPGITGKEPDVIAIAVLAQLLQLG
jgi:xanthine dehydrogenase accessory factor